MFTKYREACKKRKIQNKKIRQSQVIEVRRHFQLEFLHALNKHDNHNRVDLIIKPMKEDVKRKSETSRKSIWMKERQLKRWVFRI